MDDNLGKWAEIARWVVSNPEKFALFLVILAGAWRWIRELLHGDKMDADRETLMDTLIRENKDLRSELRDERKRNRRSGADENSGRPL
jgi:hypothetical protein